MHRRGFLTCMGTLATSPWLLGCGRNRPLVVGIHPWVGYETLYLARGFRWLPPGVQLHEGSGASALMAALREGTLDAVCLTLDQTLRARAEGLPLCVALVFDASAGADAVLVRPSIKTLADLAGKRLGVEQNALGALMQAKLLEAAGLRASDLTVVDLPPHKQLAAWHRKEVDAVITFEPTATLLARQGAKVLFDSSRIPQTIFDVLAVRTDRAGARQAPLRGLLAGHFRGLAHLQTNREDAIYRIAARQGIEPGEVQQALSGVQLPSLAGNREYLVGPESRLLRAARTVSGILVRNQVLKQEDTLEGLLAPTWLPRDGD